jgi:hypothetical protein
MATPAPYLAEEILEEILIRLPTLAALARASTACASFRRIITSRSFLRRYSKLYPPPLREFATENGGFDPVQEPDSSVPLARALADAADFSYSFVPNPDESMPLVSLRRARRPRPPLVQALVSSDNADHLQRSPRGVRSLVTAIRAAPAIPTEHGYDSAARILWIPSYPHCHWPR